MSLPKYFAVIQKLDETNRSKFGYCKFQVYVNPLELKCYKNLKTEIVLWQIFKLLKHFSFWHHSKIFRKAIYFQNAQLGSWVLGKSKNFKNILFKQDNLFYSIKECCQLF